MKKPPLQKDYHRHISKEQQKKPVPFATDIEHFLASEVEQFKPKNNDINKFQQDVQSLIFPSIINKKLRYDAKDKPLHSQLEQNLM